MKKLFVIGAMLFGVSLFAQNDYIELIRSDIQTEKKAIITENMTFSEDESAMFWPIYNDFQHEFGKIQDDLMALIKDYASNYESMTDEKAKELWTRYMAIDTKKLNLDKKYFKIMNKDLSTRTVVKFFQIENRLEKLLDLQLSSELPLMTK